MKTKQLKLSKLILLFILLGIGQFTIAQLGYSSASMAMGRMGSNSGMIPTPDQVIVEEYFNYHKHQLTAPEEDQPIAIDINSYVSADNSTILQVGLNTGFIKNMDNIPPVNVCLVIDRSGSMQGDRIEKAREAAVEFVKRLREKDIVSVVLFDDQIDVLLPAQHATDKAKLIAAIRTIEVRGSTDLNGGLIQGYSEVMKNYDNGQNNKVIMLTDAIANTGVVDPLQIIKGSDAYKTEYEIDITMVGIGVDFNNTLSRKISNNNSSSIFFVNDAEDIKKVFIDEIESLLSPVARDVKLHIAISSEFEIEKCFGYMPKMHNNEIVMDLENMNSGLTQVILIKLKNKRGRELSYGDITAKLAYFDIAKQTNETLSESNSSKKNQSDVEKNYTIARMAQCIKDMSILAKAKDYSEAKYRVDYILESTLTSYPKMEDADIKRVYDILSKYKETLSQFATDDAATLSFPY